MQDPQRGSGDIGGATIQYLPIGNIIFKCLWSNFSSFVFNLLDIFAQHKLSVITIRDI